jgi:hypothetical protein
MKTRLLAASMILALPLSLFSDQAGPPPLLEFTSGLPGRQVRLSWPAEAGLRYRIERSSGLVGDWRQVALVEPTAAEGVWRDPEPTAERAFYRVVQPQAEVFSISPPLLSPLGGDLWIHAQCLPAGSVLVLEVEGVAMEVVLERLGNGLWRARSAANFNPGTRVVATAIKDALGATLVSLNQPIEVTATGRATDSPPGSPPASPVDGAKPIPSIGIVVKSNKPYQHRANGGGGGGGGEGFAFFSKKGYDYYQAQSDLSHASLHNNPAFQDHRHQGTMAKTSLQNNPTFQDSRNEGNMPGFASDSTGNPLYDDTGREVINPLYQGKRTLPNPFALPGEVSFHTCDLVVPCPAGPPLAWIGTYRSMLPLSSGHGPGWDFSYNISIEPIPATAGTSAPRLRLRDGGGQASILLRQADGSYLLRADLTSERFLRLAS